MANKCAGCGKFMNPSEGASCSSCKSIFHNVCVGIQEKTRLPAGWTCPDCKAKRPRKNNDDTPVKTTAARELVPDTAGEGRHSPASGVIGNRAGDSSMAEELRLFRDTFKEEIGALRKEMQEIRRELSNVSASLLRCDKRIDNLESRFINAQKENNKRMEELEGKIVTQSDTRANNNNNMDSTIAQLKSELNDRDQELLLNDVEITSIPEEKMENTAHVASLIAVKLGVKIGEGDIVKAERVGPARAGREDAARPIVVRLVRRALRDELLKAARVRRGATTADMGLPGSPRRFYVNERLTKTNRQLFNNARATAKKCRWKYTWTRDGRIYARKSEGQSGLRIRTEQDIFRVFGTDKVDTNC
ncbi:uncharacterized protein LOC112058317 [Bicyclus anynana]|uniref:Uncharacterized protein LOC112058317 n=1 Tax=Bicyclus anynana TaxID=110368 RepID=A0A6J1PAW5_BICAN|nr:uncharacterized protein LOC112058317 [Bicyclus anynana]